ncbi:MAG: DUF89 domain-containing protein [Candidatus Hermodarchaeota archaeon]
MQLEPECIGCLFNQMLRAFKLLDPKISREKILNAQKKLMEVLIDLDFNKNASPIVGKKAYGLVAETLGFVDPYLSLKKQQNRLALSMYDEVKKLVETSKDPLFEAIIIAALSNTIDLAAQHEIDFINDIKNFSSENLVINDFEEFKKALEATSHLLIIGDNNGEIVFDKLLIETILRLYPNLKIVYSVRSAPIINDVTIKDAKFIGITDLVEVVESSPTPGVDLSSSTEEFKKYFFFPEGIILSKGQGNFESLYGIEIPNKQLFYLLKVKCTLMERIFNVKLGDLIFKKKTSNF